MKATMENTSVVCTITTLDGQKIKARKWNAVSEKGIPFTGDDTLYIPNATGSISPESGSGAYSGARYAPLLGRNLVRLIYLDEAGTDARAPILAVAGVLVHGDGQWPEIDRRILELIDKYVEEDHRPDFFFHATDIYHGSGYFDRRKPEWDTLEKRLPIITDLANIIADLSLPVVLGQYTKEKFGTTNPFIASAKDKKQMIQCAAIIDCAVRADAWLEKYAPDELGTVIHEDGVDGKRMIKELFRVIRNEPIMRAQNFPDDFKQQFNLPLKRIIDTVHFAEKADARPLQLADLCAFIFARGLKYFPIPQYAFEVIWHHARWYYSSVAETVSWEDSQ